MLSGVAHNALPLDSRGMKKGRDRQPRADRCGLLRFLGACPC